MPVLFSSQNPAIKFLHFSEYQSLHYTVTWTKDNSIRRRFHNGHNQMDSEQNAEDSGCQPEDHGTGRGPESPYFPRKLSPVQRHSSGKTRPHGSASGTQRSLRQG